MAGYEALTGTDIDLLSESVRDGSTDTSFDLNGDGDLNDLDRTVWVKDAAATFFGNADLDGRVEFPDFLALSDNFDPPGGWAQGDFDGSGDVQFADFLALSANFGEGVNATAAAVPEPKSIWVAMFGILGLIGFRRRR